MRIYIVRHGETDWNLNFKVQGGSSDIPLNQNGFEQAKKIAQRLKDEKVSAIYSSPLKRAIDTANEINRYHNKEIFNNKKIIERDFGKLEGSDYKKLSITMKKIILLNEYDKYEVERIEEFEKRVKEFIHEIHEKHFGENIILVSHSAVTKMIISIVNKIPIEKAREIVGYKRNASLTTIQLDENKNIVDVIIGESDHL